MAKLFACALIIWIVGACSSADPATAPATDPTAPAPAPTAEATAAEPNDVEPTAVEAVERTAPNPGDGSPGADFWIGRGEMTEQFVELIWSPIEASSVTYRIYRVPSVGTDLATVDLKATTLIYESSDPAATHFDDTVEANVFYSYLLVPDVDGVTLERRWTDALTTTDTTPPTQPLLTLAERTDDGVKLCWEPSSDDIEFASYSVSLVAGDELRYLGGGADIEQTCFVDTLPPATEATYAVQAVDFHDNRSETSLATVGSRS